MKKLILTAGFAILIFHLCIGQSALVDKQWYVKKDLMINGGNYVGYIPDVDLNIRNIMPPNSTCNGSDDLFIIFTDGTHYNTRQGITINQYVNDDLAISTTQSNKIMTLYATNKYDSDPPVQNIVVQPEWTTSANQSYPFHLISNSTTPTTILSANHDIRLEKDITLVVKGGSLTEGNYSLYFNYLIDQNQSTSTVDDGFIESNVFDNNFYYSETSLNNTSLNSDHIDFIIPANDHKDIYFNIQPTDELKDYKETDTSLYSVIFILVTKGESPIIASLTESIRNSHDPNYTQPINLYECRENQYVDYFCTFYNATTTPADSLQMDLEFPFNIEPRCVKFLSASANGDPLNINEIQIEYLNNTQSCKIVFDPKTSIAKCSNNENGEGGVVKCTLRVKIPQNFDFLTEELALASGETIFDAEKRIERRYTLTNEKYACLFDFYKSGLKNEQIINLTGSNYDSIQTYFPTNTKKDCTRRVENCPFPWLVLILALAAAIAIIIWLYHLFNKKK